MEGGFYIGLHRPPFARYFPRSFISVNAIRERGTGFPCGGQWIMDSGAFTEVTTHGGYRSSTFDYAEEIQRWSRTKTLRAAVTQDYMCEEFVLKKTGLTVAEHQRLTVERYDDLVRHLVTLRCRTYLMPVLQGYAPSEYTDHLRMYSDRLLSGAWVGVGSVCKRNADPDAVYAVLRGIKTARPDLRLHGFGLKITALSDPRIVRLLYSADSMSWSDAARQEALPLLLKLRVELGRKIGPQEARKVYRSRGVVMPDANGLSEAMVFWKTVNARIEGAK